MAYTHVRCLTQADPLCRSRHRLDPARQRYSITKERRQTTRFRITDQLSSKASPDADGYASADLWPGPAPENAAEATWSTRLAEGVSAFILSSGGASANLPLASSLLGALLPETARRMRQLKKSALEARPST